MIDIIGASGDIKVSKDELGNIIIDIDPTYGGQVSINTVGTVVTGRWCAESIDAMHGGTGLANEGILAFKGDCVINGPIIINCNNTEESTTLYVDSNGTIAVKEKSLQIENALTELCEKSKNIAYNHLSPNTEHGDISYFDEDYGGNIRLPIGKFDQVLTVGIDSLPEWVDLLSSYRYVSCNDHEYESETLEFGLGFKAAKNGENTYIYLNELLNNIVGLELPGLLAFTGEKIIPISISTYGGLACRESISNDGINYLLLGLDESYHGQTSIHTVGTIIQGEWRGSTIEPKYGGTGHANEHAILINGPIDLDTTFFIIDNKLKPEQEANTLTMMVNGNTVLELPNDGKLATEQDSLQIRHNLKDLDNPREAFRHISPTERRGDLIVRGYGDYDIPLPIGSNGDILTVNHEKNGCLEWKKLDIDQIINTAVNLALEAIEKKEAAKEKQPKIQECFGQVIELEETLHALCAQFDSMIRSRHVTPTRELKITLEKWDNYLKSKKGGRR